MKKVLATILAMAMILSLGVISFAAEPQWTGDTDGTVTPDDGTNAKSIQENGSASTWFKVLDKSDTIPDLLDERIGSPGRHLLHLGGWYHLGSHNI